MLNATISADIVSSTSLSVEELTLLQTEIRHFLDQLSDNSQGNDWGRLFKGDSVEIFLLDPRKALRIALLLKALVKKAPISLKSNNEAKRMLFRKYGIRIAIGIGAMRVEALPSTSLTSSVSPDKVASATVVARSNCLTS